MSHRPTTIWQILADLDDAEEDAVEAAVPALWP